MLSGGHFEFLIRARSAGARSGTDITEVWDGQGRAAKFVNSRRIRSLTEDKKSDKSFS